MTKIILIGMKSSGKTTTGTELSKKLNVNFIDADREIEKTHFKKKKEELGFREIFLKYGREYFRNLELETLERLSYDLKDSRFVLATGGGMPLNKSNQEILQKMGTVIFLDIDETVLLPRILSLGMPAFFPYPNDPQRSLSELLDVRRPIYTKIADMTIKFSIEFPETLVNQILSKL